MMNIMMPLISVWISWGYTAALGFYWIASNIVAIAQIFILNKIYSPAKALQEVEDKIQREKEAEKEKRRLAAERKAAAMSSKNKKKKNAMNAQNVQTKESDGIDTENSEETENNGN
jgi:YidC/Oxa1 family membrane protein insertase